MLLASQVPCPTAAVALLLLAACGGATDVITPPPPPSAGYAFTFVPDPEDLATAGALGWHTGLPGMSVSLTPADSSAAPVTLTTNSEGTATATSLVAGDYIVEAARWLSNPEQASLPGGDDAVGFAARTAVRTTGLTGSIRIEVPASRRRGLVISEWAFNRHGYDFGGFLELFNNGDTTAYLDGLILGEGWWASLDAGVLRAPLPGRSATIPRVSGLACFSNFRAPDEITPSSPARRSWWQRTPSITGPSNRRRSISGGRTSSLSGLKTRITRRSPT